MKENRFDRWKASVDRIMEKRFAIDTINAGIDDLRLREHFESHQPAADFVEWYGNKYDLEEYRPPQ